MPTHNTYWEKGRDGAPHRHKDAQNSGWQPPISNPGKLAVVRPSWTRAFKLKITPLL